MFDISILTDKDGDVIHSQQNFLGGISLKHLKFFYGTKYVATFTALLSCQTMSTTPCELEFSKQAWIAKCQQRNFEVLTYDNGPDDLSSGLRRYRENNKVGYIDAFGNIVIKAKYDFAYPFKGDLARVCNECKLEKKPGEEYTSVTGGKWETINLPKDFNN